jgi:malate dehydrogenase (oxaloacetate-decarboxylating)
MRGTEILHDPLRNKGSAFTQNERDALGLNGLLPYHISSLEEQLKRSLLNLNTWATPLGKYVALISLMNRNEMLFYQFAARYITEVLPIIYTPTVGEAATHFSLIYSQRRGTYLPYPLIDEMEEMIANIPRDDAEVIVVTDGERVLGLGDQGLGGMAISIGKCALYTIFGGIHPGKTLPIVLDVGTNNEEHLKNDLYLGWRHPRIHGAEYDRFIEKFVKAIKKRYPNVLLQWEDFAQANATRLLKQYRSKILSFNDDIQGTGAVTLAGLYAAAQITGKKLSQHRVAILGGGSAGCGIGATIVEGMMQEGLSHQEALQRLFVIDSHGLLHTNSSRAFEHQKPILHPYEGVRGWAASMRVDEITLMDVIEKAHPTILIGVCGQSGVFTKEIITNMAKHTERPIVFPLSNPTSQAECTPKELIEWTKGKAIIATGSPFAPVDYQGKKFSIAQCNNAYIFPGIGLGALAAKASQVTDGMFLEAARVLASFSPALKNPAAGLFPTIEEVRATSRNIAIGVAKQAILERVAKISSAQIEKRVDELMWSPSY